MADITLPGSPRVETERPARFAEFWRYFRENRGAVAGLIFLGIVVFLAVFADVILAHSPYEQYRDAILKPPFWQEGTDPRFILGTDGVGHDMVARLIYGARYSLFIGAAVVAIAMVVGITLGLVAGFVRGLADTAIMRVMDIILSFPSLLLALVLVAVLGDRLYNLLADVPLISLIGAGLFNAMIAIAIVLLPHYVRLTRAAVMSERTKDYVTAARVTGAGPLRLMFRTILPNCMAPLIVQATLSFSNAILEVAALGFLGMGAQPPTPEWGTMLADAREFITRAWWVVTLPGIAILLTVLAINLIGDGLRDALDPKMKRS
jgi:dipeptide transport system permease protein